MQSLAFIGGSLGAGEIVLVLGVVLLLFGADRLPSIARALGRTMEELRRAAHDLTDDMLAPPPARPHDIPPAPLPPASEPQPEDAGYDSAESEHRATEVPNPAAEKSEPPAL